MMRLTKMDGESSPSQVDGFFSEVDTVANWTVMDDMGDDGRKWTVLVVFWAVQK